MTIVFDTETIRIIALFENITSINVKDCLIQDDTIYILINEGERKKLAGKKVLLKMIEKILGKKIRIFEYSKDVVEFLRRSIPKLISLRIRNENGKKTVEVRVDRSVKGLVIGRNKKNLKIYKEFLERHYGINEIKVR